MKKLSIENLPTREGISTWDTGTDDVSGISVTPFFERFNACNTVFARAQWDTRIRTTKGIEYLKSLIGHPSKIKKTEGYRQTDFALRNASWVGANLMMERSLRLERHDGFLDPIIEYRSTSSEQVPIESPEIMSAELKKAARLFGAEMAGITAVDKRWHYSHAFNAISNCEKPAEFQDGLVHCIVLGISMPHEIVATYPSALAGTAPGFGYTKESILLQSLSQFIRNLGYRAMASLSDTAQSIPYALQAGLGEYARNGLLITKEYGPRIRFGMIFTDLPLCNDKPVKFGVSEFCKICRKCADACPAKAISFGEPSDVPVNSSNIKGVQKWTVDGEKCFNIWSNQGTECGICIRVCPYNKSVQHWGERIYFYLFRRLAGGKLRKIALWMDNVLDFGKRKSPQRWWKNQE